MPVITKELEKARRRAAKAEHSEKERSLDLARKELDARDAAILRAQDEKLKQLEKQIQAEVEVEYQRYLEREKAEEAALVRTENARLEAKKEKFRVRLRSEALKVKSNIGSKKVVNEEVLASRERYIIRRIDVAKGTFSRIYKARGPTTGDATTSDIVVKVTPMKGLDPKYSWRYNGAFTILRYLRDHPNNYIVPIVEIFNSPEKSYVFMQPMDPVDLLKRIKKSGAFDETTALAICKGVGDGITYLHSIGVAHENIKPESVIFDAANRPRLCGLGWSVIYFDGETGSLIKQAGSSKQKFHHHLAPERLKDDPYDPSIADIWSFGVLLAILLTKEWPFESHSKHSKDLTWKLVFKKNGIKLSDAIYTILSKCFIVKPADRPAILDILNEFPVNRSSSSVGSNSAGSTVKA